MGVNKHQIIGRLGVDPESKVAPGGRMWTKLWVATNERWRDRDGQLQVHTEWHCAVCWGPRAEVAARFLRKGSQLYLSGPVRTREYTDPKTGEKRQAKRIQVRQLVFLDPRTRQQVVDLGGSAAADDGAASDEPVELGPGSDDLGGPRR